MLCMCLQAVAARALATSQWLHDRGAVIDATNNKVEGGGGTRARRAVIYVALLKGPALDCVREPYSYIDLQSGG